MFNGIVSPPARDVYPKNRSSIVVQPIEIGHRLFYTSTCQDLLCVARFSVALGAEHDYLHVFFLPFV